MSSEKWREHSACSGTKVDFFSGFVTEEMKNLCKGCPVQDECLKYAIETESYGYWAGTTEQERFLIRRDLGVFEPGYNPSLNKQMRRAMPKAKHVLKEIEHGTEKGYQLHIRRKWRFVDENNQVCECRKAHTEFIKKYRESRVKT